MKRATLQFKTRIVNANILSSNAEASGTVLRIMLATLVALAFLYVLIIGNTILNIVERKSLEKRALTLRNEVSELEISYLSISSSLDLAVSSSMGFKEIKASFATRKPLGYNVTKKSFGNVGLANNEI